MQRLTDLSPKTKFAFEDEAPPVPCCYFLQYVTLTPGVKTCIALDRKGREGEVSRSYLNIYNSSPCVVCMRNGLQEFIPFEAMVLILLLFFPFSYNNARHLLINSRKTGEYFHFGNRSARIDCLTYPRAVFLSSP